MEGKRLHLLGVYPTELPAELFCGAGELQIRFNDKPGLHIRADIMPSSAAAGNRLQIHRFCCFPVAGGVGLRQYRVVRWFLLPEGELCLRPAATLDCKSTATELLLINLQLLRCAGFVIRRYLLQLICHLLK